MKLDTQISREEWQHDLEARIAYHRERIERETAKWQLPSFSHAIHVGRKAREGGWENVIDAVCHLYRLSPARLSHRRRQVDTECRAAIVWVLREMKYSWPEIAKRVGQPSHSSTISAWRQARRRIECAA